MNFPQNLSGNCRPEDQGKTAMKPETNNQLPAVNTSQSRPPPFVHPNSEPEYDTEQLARRASQVTNVLEHILEERPPLPDPGAGPLIPPAVPPRASI